MKQTLVYYVIVNVIGFVSGTSALGQITSTAKASVTIVQPVNLAKIRDLSFGNITPGETSGTVILDPSASSNRTATGGVTLTAGSSTVQSAKFILTGAEAMSYTIILPSVDVTLSNGTNFMTVNNFTCTPPGTGTINSGSQIIYVGATLRISAKQEPGEYKSTHDFEITVNYN